MSLLLPLLSIAIRVVATAWSVILVRRSRDWRMGLLTLLLAVLTLHQALLLVGHLRAGAPDGLLGVTLELPALMVSVLACFLVFLLDRLLVVLRGSGSRRPVEPQRTADWIAASGQEFFEGLVRHLSATHGVRWAVVAELDWSGEDVHTLAVSEKGKRGEAFTAARLGSPWEDLSARRVAVTAAGVSNAFAGGDLVRRFGIDGYAGVTLRDADGEPIGILAAMHDRALTDPDGVADAIASFSARAATELARQRAEAALRDSEAKYRALFEDSHDAVFISTPDGRFVDINPAGVRLFGYDSKEELLDADIESELYWDPEARKSALRRLERDGAVMEFEIQGRRRDGRKLVLLETSNAVHDRDGRVIAYRGILRDVTARRGLEEQLRRSQRMEAVGRLAGGVAHDFNNILTVIQGHCDLLVTQLPQGSELVREIEEIKRAGRRAAAFTRQLLLLARRRVAAPALVDWNVIVSGMEELLARTLGEDIEMLVRLGDDIGAVEADPSQLEQVLLNLAVNARDAMPGGGTLTIETRSRPGEPAPSDPTGSPVDCVRLRVADNGKGIDATVREHIFEPFFTTKDPTIGTGLGLSTVYGIVEQSGGWVTVDSAPGRGATFDVYLPRSEGTPLPAPKRQDTPHPDAVGGEEVILLVEDEPAVRNLLAKFLSRRGYQVVPAEHGEAAIAAAADAEVRIDLLMTDVVMPGIGGGELAERLCKERPGLKVLFMSGYTDGTLVDRESMPEGAAFLQKPFATETLARTLRELLG